MPFKPNKKYTVVALYAAAVSAIAIICGVMLFNLPAVFSFCSRLLSGLSPVLYAGIVAFLMRPIVSRVERVLHRILGTERKKTEKWRRRTDALVRMLSIAFSFSTIFFLLFCFFYFIVPLLIGDGKALVEGLEGVIVKAFNLLKQFDLLESVAGVIGIDFSLSDSKELANFLVQKVSEFRMQIVSIGTQTAATLFNLVLGLCISIGILFHRKHIATAFRHFGAAWFPLRVFRYLERMAFYSNRVFGKYLVGKIIECTIVGAIYFVIFAVINYFFKGAVPYPVLLTMIMTVTNFIPIIGAIIGGIPCGILILTGTHPLMVVWFIVLVLAIEQLDGNLIFPKVIGTIIDLRGVWIMVAVALFGGMFGMVGMFLSPPLFSIIYMLLRDFSNHRLKQKGLPIETDYYTDRFASTAPPRKRRFKHHFHIGVSEHEEQDAALTRREARAARKAERKKKKEHDKKGGDKE